MRSAGNVKVEHAMQDWKQGFLDKLGQVQSQWSKRFEEVLEDPIGRVFEDLSSFLRNHGFHTATPLKQEGRRSFKFELAENAYLLMIFRSTSVGEFEIRTECFVPGAEPVLSKTLGRVADASEPWVRQQFQSSLDRFVEQLSGNPASRSREEDLVLV